MMARNSMDVITCVQTLCEPLGIIVSQPIGKFSEN